MSRYKILRAKKHLTQTGISMRIGIDQSDYSKIERGIKEPTYYQCKQLAKLFGTSMDYLAELTDEERPYPRSQKETRS